MWHTGENADSLWEDRSKMVFVLFFGTNLMCNLGISSLFLCLLSQKKLKVCWLYEYFFSLTATETVPKLLAYPLNDCVICRTVMTRIRKSIKTKQSTQMPAYVVSDLHTNVLCHLVLIYVVSSEFSTILKTCL